MKIRFDHAQITHRIIMIKQMNIILSKCIGMDVIYIRDQNIDPDLASKKHQNIIEKKKCLIFFVTFFCGLGYPYTISGDLLN